MDVEDTVFLLPGPVKMHPRVLRAMGMPAINHRSAAFQEVLGEVRELTKYLFQTSGRVAVLSGSGTAGLDAAASALLRREDPVLCLVNGKFSERFHDLCKVYAKPTALEFEWGQPVDPARVSGALEEGDFKAVTVCHNETSTGLTN
ncbi:MAG: aminotransferase, partial [Gemmatimonadetes bacterium]